MKKRRLLMASFVIVLLLSSVVGTTGALASTINDLKKEQKQNSDKKSNLNKSIKNKDHAIKTTETEIQKFLNQISKLNKEMDETNTNMNRVISKINKTNDEIAELRESIDSLEKKIAERDVVLRERVRAMQVKGGKVSYIDVLLGANSFADFIDRFSAVTTLMDADRDIMRMQKEDIEQLETEKALVEKKLEELEAAKAQLEKLKANLDRKKAEKSKVIDQLEAEQNRLSKEKEQLEEEFHEAIEIEAELEKKVIAEQKRIAEIARKEAERKAAERKRKAKEAAERAAAANRPSALPPVSNGFWTKPANGRYSSSFGWRMHPIYHTARQHRGADLAVPIGSTVVAAGDGVVNYAGQMGGYGNVIMITHYNNGQTFTTVYAHLSSIGVSVGQVIDKGTRIGASGNTGASTGPHLHFEMHIGNWTASGPSAVNPLRYVSF